MCVSWAVSNWFPIGSTSSVLLLEFVCLSACQPPTKGFAQNHELTLIEIMFVCVRVCVCVCVCIKSLLATRGKLRDPFT